MALEIVELTVHPERQSLIGGEEGLVATDEAVDRKARVPHSQSAHGVDVPAPAIGAAVVQKPKVLGFEVVEPGTLSEPSKWEGDKYRLTRSQRESGLVAVWLRTKFG